MFNSMKDAFGSALKVNYNRTTRTTEMVKRSITRDDERLVNIKNKKQENNANKNNSNIINKNGGKQ